MQSSFTFVAMFCQLPQILLLSSTRMRSSLLSVYRVNAALLHLGVSNYRDVKLLSNIMELDGTLLVVHLKISSVSFRSLKLQ